MPSGGTALKQQAAELSAGVTEPSGGPATAGDGYSAPRSVRSSLPSPTFESFGRNARKICCFLRPTDTGAGAARASEERLKQEERERKILHGKPWRLGRKQVHGCTAVEATGGASGLIRSRLEPSERPVLPSTFTWQGSPNRGPAERCRSPTPQRGRPSAPPTWRTLMKEALVPACYTLTLSHRPAAPLRTSRGGKSPLQTEEKQVCRNASGKKTAGDRRPQPAPKRQSKPSVFA